MMKRRPAFTFMEVLFAVMILGIGMIMVAAMFPAALKQTQANLEDGASGSVAQGGDSTMMQLANNKDLPLAVPVVDTLDRLLYSDATSDDSVSGTPYVYSFHDPRIAPPASIAPTTTASELWQFISSNLVSPTDPQYAWVPLFSRNKVPGPTTNPGPHPNLDRAFRLFVIPVRCRNRSAGYVGTIPNITTGSPTQAQYYAASDVYIDSANDPANLDPAIVKVNLIVPSAALLAQGNQPYLQVAGVYYSGVSETASYSDAGGASPNTLDSNPQWNPVTTGAYVVISNAGPRSIYNGAIFKIGTQVQSDGTGVGTTGEYWSIAPDPNGYSLSALVGSPGPGANVPVNFALVVGRGPDVSSQAYATWAATPTNSPMPRAGAAQDIGMLMTVVALP